MSQKDQKKNLLQEKQIIERIQQFKYSLTSNDKNPYSIASQKGDIEAIDFLHTKGLKVIELGIPFAPINQINNVFYNALDYAVKKGDIKCVEKLLSLGASPNKPTDIEVSRNYERKGSSEHASLYQAYHNEQLEIFKLLLTHGANPNLHFMYDQSCVSLLSLTCAESNYEFMDVLLDHGVEINASNKSHIKNPLHVMAGKTCRSVEEFAQESAVIKKLISFGADINAVTSQGDTPLRICLNVQDINVKLPLAKLLISEGADINVKMKYSYSYAYTSTIWDFLKQNSSEQYFVELEEILLKRQYIQEQKEKKRLIL